MQPGATPKLSIIVPSSRKNIKSLTSITEQMLPGDELILHKDATGDWGATPRTKGMLQATGDYLLFMDDDDQYSPKAFEIIRKTITAEPSPCYLFRMTFADKRPTLWKTEGVIECGNVSTQIFVVINDKAKLGRWGIHYAGDFDFIRETIKNHDDKVIWKKDVIAHWIHDKSVVPPIIPPAGSILVDHLRDRRRHELNTQNGAATSMNEGLRRQQELNCGAPPDFHERKVGAMDLNLNLLSPPTTKPSPLYAVIGSWFDGDVIEACVKNCFSQGCDRVYLIDNNSPDDTVKRAEAAGAILAESYKTDFYDEDLRIQLCNQLCKQITAREAHEEIWWLCIDSDEFPHGHKGEPLKTTLSRQPREIRTLGFNFFDLYPTTPYEYLTGSHPAECMKWGAKRYGGMKKYGESCNHWKHPLLRYFGGMYDVYQSRGFHAPKIQRSQPQTVLEPADTTFWCFHAPFRARDYTIARLQTLCRTGRSRIDDQVTGNQGAIKRWASLEAVYSGKWDQVEIAHTQMFGRPVKGIALYEWRKVLAELSHLFLKEPLAGEEKEKSRSIHLPTVS